jgi:aminoglycoside phosphotransferase (APT) family kinase protein
MRPPNSAADGPKAGRPLPAPHDGRQGDAEALDSRPGTHRCCEPRNTDELSSAVCQPGSHDLRRTEPSSLRGSQDHLSDRERLEASSVSGVHDLGPTPSRLVVDVELVHQLIAEQFPQWSNLPISPVANGGWDNWTFHLGSQMSVRLPSAAEYALAVDKEHRWLPQLAAQLPLPIPTPLGKGLPNESYPFVWSVYRWLDGDPVTPDRITGGIVDPVRFALELADFLTALHQVDPTDGPPPGTHNWFRGGTLRTYDATTQAALTTLRDRTDVDVGLAHDVWTTALDARWDGVPFWFHGDIAEGNLLLRDGHLVAVIDFGTCGVGDRSCDLAGAWTLLDAVGRDALRDHLAVDEGTWARGRGWALWKALATYAQAIEQDREASTKARRVLDAILEDYQTDHGIPR